MTGMLNFNYYLCFALLTGFTIAAEVSLIGNHKLTGELTTMDDDGNVSLITSYSDDPLKIRGDKLIKIVFNKSNENINIPDKNIVLINGDSFPCDILGFDEKIVKTSSPTLGQLDIPREMIDSIEVGTSVNQFIYNGPTALNEWKNVSDEISTWDVDKNGLFSTGLGKIYRDMQLPDAYSIRFQVSWENKPNFRFTFADPMDFSGIPMNRYYIQFNSAGMEIKREATAESRFTTIAVIDRKPEDFSEKKFRLEIKVDSNSNKLELYIDDLLEGRRYVDRIPNFPKGKGISFAAVAAEENEFRISNLQISKWHDGSDKHRSEDRGDGKLDAVIGRNGERFSGRLLAIIDSPNGKLYRFKSDFLSDPMDLPETEVSKVFFTKTLEQIPGESKVMNLSVIDGAKLQIYKCRIDDNFFNVTHPLLGDISLNRNNVTSLQRITEPKLQTKGK